MKVKIEKEIDDDHVIISTAKGDRLLLEKWSLKFSPLSFEGKTFIADVSPTWVIIYVKGKGEIKWSVENDLGNLKVEKKFKNKSIYYVTGSEHWIQEISGGGKIIILEDGSIWEVSPIDVIDSALWLPTSNIIVVLDVGPYPYKLINTDDKETVNAKLIK
jgi:hypothetical protein